MYDYFNNRLYPIRITTDPLPFEERWTFITSKSVPDVLENTYMVSSNGRLYNTEKNKYMPYNMSNSGYLQGQFKVNGAGRIKRYVHRIMMIEFVPVENYEILQVNHKNGNKTDNYLWNLEWVTPKENSRHAVEIGLNNQLGENCNFAKITENQAIQIAQLLLENKTIKEVAEIVGCGIPTVESIRQGIHWKYIYDRYNLASIKQEQTHWSDEEIDGICKFIYTNKSLYSSQKELLNAAMNHIFGRDMTNADRSKMIRYINHQARLDITGKYDF